MTPHVLLYYGYPHKTNDIVILSRTFSANVIKLTNAKI